KKLDRFKKILTFAVPTKRGFIERSLIKNKKIERI
ncbi:hypothetical protein ACVWYN_003750, partial [Pedobacter sp. UYP24]